MSVSLFNYSFTSYAHLHITFGSNLIDVYFLKTYMYLYLFPTVYISIFTRLTSVAKHYQMPQYSYLTTEITYQWLFTPTKIMSRLKASSVLVHYNEQSDELANIMSI